MKEADQDKTEGAHWELSPETREEPGVLDLSEGLTGE